MSAAFSRPMRIETKDALDSAVPLIQRSKLSLYCSATPSWALLTRRSHHRSWTSSPRSHMSGRRETEYYLSCSYSTGDREFRQASNRNQVYSRGRIYRPRKTLYLHPPSSPALFPLFRPRSYVLTKFNLHSWPKPDKKYPKVKEKANYLQPSAVRKCPLLTFRRMRGYFPTTPTSNRMPPMFFLAYFEIIRRSTSSLL